MSYPVLSKHFHRWITNFQNKSFCFKDREAVSSFSQMQMIKLINWLIANYFLDQGCVVQRCVKFNPGLSKNYSSNFSQEKITVLIKYFSDFPKKKLVISKFAAQFRLWKVDNKARHGLKI